MTLATRMTLILIVTLMLPLADVALAQETTPAVETVTETETVVASEEATSPAAEEAAAATGEAVVTDPPPQMDRHELRTAFGRLLLNHPRYVATVLVLDPSLLENEQFLARYPQIPEFLDRFPQIREDPAFYLVEFAHRVNPNTSDPLDDVLEMFSIVAVFGLIAVALAWIIRTIIEQKRWNRLSRTQVEVHNKILDRFGSSEELLEYVRSPAGTKFLESAPIPLRAEQPQTKNAPLTRIMWSIQIGVVIIAGGLGMLLVSLPLDGEGAQALFALGAIAFCIGGGFIASALVSIIFSRRLGLWEHPAPAPSGPLDEPGHVR